MDTTDTDTTTQAPDLDPKAELARLRDRRAAAETRRAELETPSLADELEAARREVADAEAVNAAITEHGKPGVKIEIVDTTLGKVIVKRCSAMRYKKFQDIGDFSAEKCEQLVRPNVVYPTLSVFDAMADEQPMIVFRCANALSRMAGTRKEDVEKK